MVTIRPSLPPSMYDLFRTLRECATLCGRALPERRAHTNGSHPVLTRALIITTAIHSCELLLDRTSGERSRGDACMPVQENAQRRLEALVHNIARSAVWFVDMSYELCIVSTPFPGVNDSVRLSVANGTISVWNTLVDICR